MIDLTVRNSVKRSLSQGCPTSQILKSAEKLVALLRVVDRELSIVLTDDREMRRLNHRYRGKDKTTDVLSFALDEGERSSMIPKRFRPLGDIVISVPTARRQAKFYGIRLQDEVLRLLVHGLLHLLGYDHENVSRREVERMRKKEESLLRKIAKQAAERVQWQKN